MQQQNYKPTRDARRARLSRRSARSRGAVIVLSLLGAFMLAGLIAYVFNTGRHAQQRQQTQHAADATAISGGGYIARAFNTVAMNNVEISRLIAVVQLLDAVPLSIEYTLLDVEATLERVQEQQRTGTGDVHGDQTLEEIEADLESQIRQLTEMNQFFNLGRYDVREMTFYDSEFGRGELWKAMESLHAISFATMEQLDEHAELTAQEAGERNLASGPDSLATMSRRETYWREYEFDDFRDPVVRGRLPQWVDDEETNRGPYDTIFGWRSTQREVTTVPNPDYRPTRTTKRPDSRWSGGTGGGGSPTIVVSSRVTGYTTYGTWQWLSDLLRNRVANHEVLPDSQFSNRVIRMAGNKLNYLWPGSATEWIFLDPEWITSFEEAEQIIASGTPRPAYTQFIVIEYQQRFINDVPVGPEYMQNSDIIRPRGGWVNVPGATKIRDHVWEDDAETVTIRERTEIDAFGNERVVEDEYKTRYRWLFIWAGMNVGPEIVIRDPNNFSDRGELPRPIDFDHDATPLPWRDATIESIYSPFTYLGIAKQSNNAQVWGQLFDTSAYDGHVALAQVSVFNNHSWDLWTQMWHAQLEPVQEYDWQVDNFETNRSDINDVLEYLRSLKPLAPTMLNH